MSLESVTEIIKQKLAMTPGLNARVMFDFGDEGLIYVDATRTPPLISHDGGEADTTFSCSLATFEALLQGSQDPNMAFMTGKLKIRGSMGLALKLNALLED